MNPLELKLKRELGDANDKLAKMRKELSDLQRRADMLDKRVTHYMGVNSDLWLQLSKLPGGLEQARRINVAHGGGANAFPLLKGQA